MGDLYKIFPKENAEFWKRAFQNQERMTEMRFRSGRPVLVCVGGRERMLGKSGELCSGEDGAVCFSQEELRRLLLHLCRYSLYAYEEEFREGYLTLEGGHRLGVAGQVVTEEGRIRTIKNIAFLNLRISHQILGAADAVLPYLYRDNRVKNTLLVSPPGCGKTTLLRDLVRQISDGNRYGRGRTVGVVDERSEIAGCCLGIPQNDLGMRTDVMDGCPKALGMILLIRSMAPEVLAVDEIGRKEDLTAVRQALTCGISVIATLHGRSREDIRRKGLEKCFEQYFFLDREEGIPCVREHSERGCGDEAGGCDYGVFRMYGNGAAVYFRSGQTDPESGRAPEGNGTHGRGDPVQQGNASGMLSACGK